MAYSLLPLSISSTCILHYPVRSRLKATLARRPPYYYNFTWWQKLWTARVVLPAADSILRECPLALHCRNIILVFTETSYRKDNPARRQFYNTLWFMIRGGGAFLGVWSWWLPCNWCQIPLCINFRLNSALLAFLTCTSDQCYCIIWKVSPSWT